MNGPAETALGSSVQISEKTAKTSGNSMLTQIKKTAVLLSLLVSSACSPSMFSSEPDRDVQKLPSYQKVNTACSSVDLSRNRFDVDSFRAIVNCFNSSGAIPEVAEFVNHTGAEQLQPVIDLIN